MHCCAGCWEGGGSIPGNDGGEWWRGDTHQKAIVSDPAREARLSVGADEPGSCRAWPKHIPCPPAPARHRQSRGNRRPPASAVCQRAGAELTGATRTADG